MISHPVFQSQLILCKFRKDLRLLVSCAKLLFHLFNDCRDSLITCMIVKCLEKIQLRILLDLYAKVVKLFDRCIACKEVCRTRSEADDL